MEAIVFRSQFVENDRNVCLKDKNYAWIRIVFLGFRVFIRLFLMARVLNQHHEVVNRKWDKGLTIVPWTSDRLFKGLCTYVHADS